MTDEIRSASIHKPRRVRPPSRDEHKGNKGRFREQMAEERDLEQKDVDAPRHDADRRREDRKPAQVPSNVGRNLDVET